MSKKDNFSQAMFEMFGLGKTPQEGEDGMGDIGSLEQLQNLNYATEAKTEPVQEDVQNTSVVEETAEPIKEDNMEEESVSFDESTPKASVVAAPPQSKPRRTNCTYFAEGTTMEGTLHCDSDVEICGDFKGSITSEGKVTIHANTTSDIESMELVLVGCTLSGDSNISGDVMVDSKSAITGNINSGNLTCSGIIHGNLNVTGNITLTENAQVVGDIHTGTLAMSRGAKVSGKIDMGGF